VLLIAAIGIVTHPHITALCPRNPTQTQILGLHFEMARDGLLKYLSINTTFNSSIQLNYRQTESAFWTWYLPTVVGYLVPTYPPSTEVTLKNIHFRKLKTK
jgi:hypothetical protein